MRECKLDAGEQTKRERRFFERDERRRLLEEEEARRRVAAVALPGDSSPSGTLSGDGNTTDAQSDDMAAPTHFVPKVEKPTFDGSTKPEDTQLALEQLSRYHVYLLRKGALPQVAFEHVTDQCLEGTAATWWSTAKGNVSTFGEFESAFKERFMRDTDCLTAGRRVMYGLRQGSKTSSQYHEEFVKRMETLRVVDFDWAVHGPKLVYLNGLNDSHKNILITHGDIEVKSVSDMAAILRNAEAAGALSIGGGGASGSGSGGSTRYDNTRYPKRTSTNTTAPNSTKPSTSNSGDAAPRGDSADGPPRRSARYGGGNGGNGSGKREPREPREPRDLSKVDCNRCGELGHLAYDCPADSGKMRAHRAAKAVKRK